MYSLIITEKPNVSERIATSLADAAVEAEKEHGVRFYRIDHRGEELVIVSAVGHLFGLRQKGKGWDYPVFETEWAPIYEVNKASAFAKKYAQTIKSLAKGAGGFVVSTDYDPEGEVIGEMIVRYLCPKGAKGKTSRMKFSTLTKDELVEAFEKRGKVDERLGEAGEARHVLDWYYGINLSRALTKAIRKATGNFITMSSGRVQGPALKILADKEREIGKFVPEDYWEAELRFLVDGKEYSALHEKGRFGKKGDAEGVLKKCRGKDAAVEKVERKKFEHAVPVPFDLTTLQTEAYGAFKFKPDYTQRLAQTLYENALISYPRTASQKLPPQIGYDRIMKLLAKNPSYSVLALELLKGKLEPKEGKAKDPAHPAIYPTGNKPSGVPKDGQRLYDLVVKRFLAVFGKPAIRESQAAVLGIGDEKFVAKGVRTVEKNWHRLYEPYVATRDDYLPGLKEGQNVRQADLLLLDKQTQPPSRYTPASIVRKLESLGLGTKATRAQIVTKLADREYVKDATFEVTKLGMDVIETLEKYSPEIIDPELTRKFEEETEGIREGKFKMDRVLADAKAHLSKILQGFRKAEMEIGTSLKKSYIETQEEKKIVGKCPACGSLLKVVRSKRTGKRFVGCSGYPKCSYSMPLPQKGSVRMTKKACPICKAPIVTIFTKGRKPWRTCINIGCPSKKQGVTLGAQCVAPQYRRNYTGATNCGGSKPRGKKEEKPKAKEA